MVAIINRRWRRSVIGTLLLVIVACAAGGSGLPAAAAPGVGRRAQTAFALYVPASPRADDAPFLNRMIREDSYYSWFLPFLPSVV